MTLGSIFARGVCTCALLAGCTGGGGGGFTVRGLVAPIGGSSQGLTAQSDPLGDKIVDRVVAITASSQDGQRLIAPVGRDGRFDLALDPARPWVLVFVDDTRVGADMIAGVFKAEGLDTLAPVVSTGEADLGLVQIGAGGASVGIAYDALLAALGLDAATAQLLGSVDDLCLRYVNPDIDGDGVLDADEPDRDLRLDFHTRFDMELAGRASTIGDIVGAFLPTDAKLRYTGTGVYASFPRRFYGGDLAAASVTFDEVVHYSRFGGAMGGAMPLSAAAGVPVGGADLSTMGYGDYASFGIDAPPGYDLPQGRYRFAVGDRTLTFTRIQTRSDAELAAARGFIMPFVRIAPQDPSCASGCAIGSIDYRWMRQSGDGWIDATTEELALLVGDQGGYVSIVKARDDGSQHVGFQIPTTAAAGTIAWSAASARLEGMTESDLASMTTIEICHFGLSYDDKLGMRMFEGIANAPGTCGTR